MFWGNSDYQYLIRDRNVSFNSAVALRDTGLNTLAGQFDDIFAGKFTDFSDEITSIQAYPFPIPYTHSGNLKSGGRQTTTVPAFRINTNIYAFWLGEHYVGRYYNNFADYNGYTKLKVYLPFMDIVDLDIDECLGKYLQFRLVVDYYTGKGMYIIGVSDTMLSYYSISATENTSGYEYVDANDFNNIRVIAKYEVQLGVSIPIGKTGYDDFIRNTVLNTLKTAASVAVTAYTGVYLPTTTQTSKTTYEIKGRGTEKGSRLKTTGSGSYLEESVRTYHDPYDKVRPYAEAFNGSIDILNNQKPSGSGDRIPNPMNTVALSPYVHVIYYRPRMEEKTDEFRHLFGTPLAEVRKLKDLRGYTEVSSIHVEGTGFSKATQVEKDMIEEVLLNGVLLPDTTPSFLGTMYIDDVDYKFVIGSTWNEWINSSYNTAGFSVSDGKVISNLGYNVKRNDVDVLGTYTIISEASYTAEPDIPEGTSIMFINGNPYVYTIGMTWQEWWRSDYNNPIVVIPTDANQRMVALIGGADLKLNGVTVYAENEVTQSRYTFNYVFTVNDISYECRYGQTWSEFISEFNPAGFSIKDGVVFVGDLAVYRQVNSQLQLPDTEILNGQVYILEEYNVQLMEFKIDDVTYYAPVSLSDPNESQMTVSEWVNSEYNTGNFFIFSNQLYKRFENQTTRPVLTVITGTKTLYYVNDISHFTSLRTYEVANRAFIVTSDNSYHIIYFMQGTTWREWINSSAMNTINVLVKTINNVESVFIRDTVSPYPELYLLDNGNTISPDALIISEKTYTVIR